jgi:hypothetical protein
MVAVNFLKNQAMDLRIFLPLSFLIGFVGAAHGQGFTDGFMTGKKKGTVALTYSYEHADTYFFGKQKQMTDYTVQSLAAYISYGVSDQFNLIASVPYMRTDSLNSALQDGIIALKYQNSQREFSDGRLRTITMVGAQFPFSDYSTQTAQPIGIRSTSFLFRLLAQYENYNGFFAHMQTGFEFRLLPDQQFGVPIIFRTGYGNSKFYFDVWLDYFHSFDEGADQTVFGGSGPRWWKTGGTLYFPVGKQFGIFTGGAYILSGRNISQSWRVNVGAVWNWEGGGE